MTPRIRQLRGRDLLAVLAIERQAFPQDPWTLSTGTRWRPLSRLGRHARYAASLAWFIRFTRLAEIINLALLIRFLAVRRPAGLYYAVAESGGTVAGYARLNAVAGGAGDLETIAVRADRRGEGIGTALLSRVIAAAADRGCQDVCLYVRADNARARLLYRRTGFTETGVRPGYYQPSGTDAIVMCLHLPGRHANPPAAGRPGLPAQMTRPPG